ncbi:2OG-Fe(II) oxygenase [Arenimonas sp. MALMAid1274]|uniref:2OG-Fe(II) oxygenase n=1 Tax=Arenimonas sp. MALMAid1274 TaxID=3411630 RepID=UPI003B9FFC0D
MPAPPSPLADDRLTDALAARLRTHDWATLDLPPDTALLVAAREEAITHAASGRLQPAATGRAGDRRHAGLRGDATLWLDDPACGAAARALLAGLDQLRVELNRRLLLGLDEVEAHFAHYPVGASYARHRDRFRSDDARVLSLVVYLNPDWPGDAGGALRLHLPEGPQDIAPRQGTLAVFLSDGIEHEVRPATRPRFSVAAWFRQRPRAG